MNYLTQRQRATLQAIVKLSGERGYPPTVREIMKEVGLTSSSTTQSLLNQLQAKGYIERQGHASRTLRVIKHA
ncbi:MarR family transcriptional regulator [Paenibacillus sp. IHBB 3054]|uniref:LexA family protein n=1 Tax=Paenibacillus sp. IHBB 3054 TaxID=3425689 RepID=UPI003F67287D